MAEDMDSHTSLFSKTRIPRIQETLLHELSNSSSMLSPQQYSQENGSTFLASTPKQDQDIIQDLPRPTSYVKVKCFFTLENQEMSTSVGQGKVVSCDLDSEENYQDFARKSVNFSLQVQETNEETVNGVKGTEGKEIVCGKIEEFGGQSTEEKKGFSEKELVEAKKKQLLAKIDANSIFEDKIHEESALGFDTGSGILGGIKGIDESVRRSLKVEVIDDTALIATIPVSKNGNGSVKIAGKKKEKQEAEGKKAKRPRRKGKIVKSLIGKAQNGGKMKYTREEMEAMRFVNIVEQQKLWRAVYTGFGDAVVRNYNDLATSRHQKNVHSNYDPCQRYGKKKHAPGVLSKPCSENGDIKLENTEDGVENLELLDSGCSGNTKGENANTFVEEDCTEEDDSDEDYASIQRPAFLVEGEPDFDSGPPEDGLEYLRRVRWEASHIPKVKVAKVDRSKFVKEQSAYMPHIPEIDKCPQHLLPSKQWEDAFLADFSELQTLLSYNEDSSTEISSKLKSMTIVQELEKFDAKTETSAISACLQNRTANSTGDSSCNYPTLFAILGMGSVARVSMLRKHISLAETMNVLSKNDCIWLFALCAAVDTPVDADTCASLRSLLRKCSSLRAAKYELDDEFIMLNILATISGRFFGQSES